MSLIRNRKGDNIVVAKGHGYTVEKVKKAMDFLGTSNRYTTLNEWVEIYNFIRNANESATGCKSCQAAKYTASVRNYAKYGYMTLINEGHKPEEFGIGVEKDEEMKPVENAENRIVTSVETPEIVTEEVKEAVDETETEKVEQPEEEKPKKTSKRSKKN